MGGWTKYLNAKGYSCYDEIHFPAIVRAAAASKQGLGPGTGLGPVTGSGAGLGRGTGLGVGQGTRLGPGTRVISEASGGQIPSHHPIVIQEYHNQAADHHAYTSHTTSTYFISSHNDIRDYEGKPYVYLHCGHSKNIETKFTQSLQLLKIATLGNQSYVIKFDGKQKISSVHILTSAYVTKNMIT